MEKFKFKNKDPNAIISSIKQPEFANFSFERYIVTPDGKKLDMFGNTISKEDSNKDG